MKRLESTEFTSFLRRYRLSGGRLRKVQLLLLSNEVAVRFLLRAKTIPKDLGAKPRRVKLRFELRGVEEYRFQKRPGRVAGAVPDARLGYFDGTIYLMFDAYALDRGEQPQLFDFRASECYAGGRELWWEEVPPKTAS